MLKCYYTVYDKETDDVLAYGTKEECSKALGMSPKNNYNAFATLVKRARQGTSSREVLIEKLDCEEINGVDMCSHTRLSMSQPFMLK